jgi:hypothetical protein
MVDLVGCQSPGVGFNCRLKLLMLHVCFCLSSVLRFVYCEVEPLTVIVFCYMQHICASIPFLDKVAFHFIHPQHYQHCCIYSRNLKHYESSLLFLSRQLRALFVIGGMCNTDRYSRFRRYLNYYTVLMIDNGVWRDDGCRCRRWINISSQGRLPRSHFTIRYNKYLGAYLKRLDSMFLECLQPSLAFCC